MKKLPFSIFKRLNLFLRDEYSIVKRKGSIFALNKYNCIDARLLCFVDYEKKNLAAMTALAKEHEIDLFFDIGANFGYYSILFSNENLFNLIFAFEPVKRNYWQLCANVWLNECKNIFVNDMALSDKVESKVMRNETVECIPLDELMPMKEQRVLMKIDVEGFEREVLHGMTEFLHNNEVVVFVESHQNYEEIKRFLSTLDYKQLSIVADDYVFSNFQTT